MILDAQGVLLEPTPWSVDAACAGTTDTDIWFPERGESSAPAKTVCATCPVTAECLAYALRWNIIHGIWGGLSTRERRRLPRPGKPRRIQHHHGTTTSYARGCRCTQCRDANRTADYWRHR